MRGRRDARARRVYEFGLQGRNHTLFLLGDLVAAPLLHVHRGLRRGEAVAGARIVLGDHVALDLLAHFVVG